VKQFVDANILVYAEDRDAAARHDKALALVRSLWDSGDGVVSLQVLQEFFVIVTRKLKKPMKGPEAFLAVEQYLTWTTVAPDAALLKAAIRLSLDHRLSFWDALVIQSALRADCAVLYSEDLNHGQRFGPLRICNPFLED
jgi:predicted nucleic acid-binding protein